MLILDETLDGLGQRGAGSFITNISTEWQNRSQNSLYMLIVTHLSKIDTSVPELVKATLSIDEENKNGL